MPAHTSTIVPLNWRSVIAEAVRRRKAESMTQKEHAALASVSIPTMLAFERGERTLSLAKAFDILRVVGLLDEPAEDGAQDAFVQHAFERWRSLVARLPKDSPGRFPHGWYRIDYCLDGDLKTFEPHELEPILDQQALRNTGWPLFVTMTRSELAPYEQDGVLECWIKPAEKGVARTLSDPAHCDFWRASPDGRFMVIRGYQEDGQETFRPSSIFDTTLPIWRIAEGLLHAARMAQVLKSMPEAIVSVRFRILYTGLKGRVLRAWGNPQSNLFLDGGAARSDEALLETSVKSDAIDSALPTLIFPMIASLYDRFGVSGLSEDRVAEEVSRFRNNRT